MSFPRLDTHAQENLQALLVDIHEDPEGFKEFVEVSCPQPSQAKESKRETSSVEVVE